ncbi:MAG: class I SAM-dependent methyltransferase [Balneolales bacterium]
MTPKEWYESWFDSPLYDLLYKSRDDAEASKLVSWLTKYVPPGKYPQVLDMGCGRGRHAILMALQGYSVTGVDLSPYAIKKARQKAQDKHISCVVFDIGDMRNWRNGIFDLVCNLFTSFGYFNTDADNISVIKNMKSHLGNDSYLVMDYLNPEYVRKNLVPEETLDVGNHICRIRRFIEGDMVVKTISFSDGASGEQRQYQERVKMYDRNWFQKVFEGFGLTEMAFFGDYEGGEFDPVASPRLLMTVRG